MIGGLLEEKRAMWGLGQMSLQKCPHLPQAPLYHMLPGSLHRDPRGGGGLQGCGASLIINNVCISGAKALWLSAAQPGFSRQKRSLEPGVEPESELFSAELARWLRQGARKNKQACFSVPSSVLHPGSFTLNQTR